MKTETGLSIKVSIDFSFERLWNFIIDSSFEYEVYVTADNSIFTCYSFLWKSENDYQIVVQPGQIMKGSRIKSDESQSSGKIFHFDAWFIANQINLLQIGEPLLVHRRTVTSSNSRPNTSTSATFDQMDQSSDQTSSEGNGSIENRNERSPVRIG